MESGKINVDAAAADAAAAINHCSRARPFEPGRGGLMAALISEQARDARPFFHPRRPSFLLVADWMRLIDRDGTGGTRSLCFSPFSSGLPLLLSLLDIGLREGE